MLDQIFGKKFSNDQKKSAVLFGIFVLVGFVMTVYGIYTSIYRPILLSKAGALKAVENLRNQVVADELNQDIVRDTDGDGINDADEIQIYRTSPYIADSDSDGISDGQEVNKGTNPNCPEGKDCGKNVGDTQYQLTAEDILKAGAGTLPTNASGTLIYPDSGAGAVVGGADTVEGNDGQTLAQYLNSIKNNPDEMRKFLLKSGFTQEQMDKIKNDELVDLFNQTLKDLGMDQPVEP